MRSSQCSMMPASLHASSTRSPHCSRRCAVSTLPFGLARRCLAYYLPNLYHRAQQRACTPGGLPGTCRRLRGCQAKRHRRLLAAGAASAFLLRFTRNVSLLENILACCGWYRCVILVRELRLRRCGQRSFTGRCWMSCVSARCLACTPEWAAGTRYARCDFATPGCSLLRVCVEELALHAHKLT